MSAMQRYIVSIFGETHTFVSDDREDAVRASAQLVDSLMKELAAKTHITDAKRLAILVAVRLAQQTQEHHTKLIDLITQKMDEAAL